MALKQKAFPIIKGGRKRAALLAALGTVMTGTQEAKAHEPKQLTYEGLRFNFAEWNKVQALKKAEIRRAHEEYLRSKKAGKEWKDILDEINAKYRPTLLEIWDRGEHLKEEAEAKARIEEETTKGIANAALSEREASRGMPAEERHAWLTSPSAVPTKAEGHLMKDYKWALRLHDDYRKLLKQRAIALRAAELRWFNATEEGYTERWDREFGQKQKPKEPASWDEQKAKVEAEWAKRIADTNTAANQIYARYRKALEARRGRALQTGAELRGVAPTIDRRLEGLKPRLAPLRRAFPTERPRRGSRNK